jgi:4-diphosphocytidyl-2-C-methyl-D-erythritol kinase
MLLHGASICVHWVKVLRPFEAEQGAAMVKLLGTLAPAKINLFLRVTGRRTDGYHELDSIFVPISLCDRVGLSLRPSHAATVLLRCNWPGLGRAEENLAVRAARAFMDEFAIQAEVMIELHKAIPPGAGLGGGSSDAGAVLRLMAQLGGINDPRKLGAIAIKLGADVPFFLNPVPARVRGIGEQIEPLTAFARLELVVAVPSIVVPTSEIFARLSPRDWSGPASDEMVRALAAGRVAPDLLVNDLAGVVTARWPAIAELKAILQQCGAAGAAMSGSGGAVFGVFATSAAATLAADEVRRRYPAASVVSATSLG